MDKTSTFRRVWFQVLLIASTIQALTPDALDLTLMAHYRPPGPVIVLMGFFADVDENAPRQLTARAPQSFSLRVSSTEDGDSSDHEPADNIWQPLWPELGLARRLEIQLRALPMAQSIFYVLIDAWDGRWSGRPGGQAISGRDLSCSLCRILC